jgi:endonuclease/exonuclease/phosphatase family metal-dependent hydrolase
MRTFRAATLNIWSRFGPWEERLVAIREGLRALAPDVLGMQEVLRCEGLDQAALVSEGLGYHVAWGEASANHGYPTGNAILSRWPILKSETLPLPDGGSDERRSAVFALLDAPFGKVPFFCTHFNWKFHHGHVRQLQVRALAEAVAERAPIGSFPPVVVGDFNAEPDSDEIRYLSGLHVHAGGSVHFRDAFRVARQLDGSTDPGVTWSHKNPYTESWYEPDRRIDYVFVGPPGPGGLGHVTGCRVVCDAPVDGVWPTDHFGVLAELATP